MKIPPPTPSRLARPPIPRPARTSRRNVRTDMPPSSVAWVERLYAPCAGRGHEAGVIACGLDRSLRGEYSTCGEKMGATGRGST